MMSVEKKSSGAIQIATALNADMAINHTKTGFFIEALENWLMMLFGAKVCFPKDAF